MPKRPTLESFWKKVMQRPGVRKAYEQLRVEYDLLDRLIVLKKQLGFAPKELAKHLGVHQLTVTRLLQGKYEQIPVGQVRKLAEALGCELKIALVVQKRPTFADFKKEAMQDPAFHEAYEELRPEYEALGEAIEARKKAHR